MSRCQTDELQYSLQGCFQSACHQQQQGAGSAIRFGREACEVKELWRDRSLRALTFFECDSLYCPGQIPAAAGQCNNLKASWLQSLRRLCMLKVCMHFDSVTSALTTSTRMYSKTFIDTRSSRLHATFHHLKVLLPKSVLCMTQYPESE